MISRLKSRKSTILPLLHSRLPTFHYHRTIDFLSWYRGRKPLWQAKDSWSLSRIFHQVLANFSGKIGEFSIEMTRKRTCKDPEDSYQCVLVKSTELFHCWIRWSANCLPVLKEEKETLLNPFIQALKGSSKKLFQREKNKSEQRRSFRGIRSRNPIEFTRPGRESRFRAGVQGSS